MPLFPLLTGQYFSRLCESQPRLHTERGLQLVLRVKERRGQLQTTGPESSRQVRAVVWSHHPCVGLLSLLMLTTGIQYHLEGLSQPNQGRDEVGKCRPRPHLHLLLSPPPRYHRPYLLLLLHHPQREILTSPLLHHLGGRTIERNAVQVWRTF